MLIDFHYAKVYFWMGVYNIEIRILVKFIELKPKLIEIKVQTYVPYLFVSNDLIRINISYQLDHLK